MGRPSQGTHLTNRVKKTRLRLRHALAAGVIVMLALPAGAASSQTKERVGDVLVVDLSPAWSQFQGGPAHQGVLSAGEAPQPPYVKAWSFARPKDEDDLSNPVIDGETVFVGGSKAVYAISLESGRQEWSVSREAEDPDVFPGAPAIAATDQRRLVLFTQGKGDDTELVAVNEADHEQKWSLPLKNDSRSGITVSGTTAYVGDESGNLYVVDTETGKLMWSESAGAGSMDWPPAVDEDTVYAGTHSQTTLSLKIVAFDTSTHESRWTFTSPVPSTTLTLDEGHVAFGNQSGSLVSLDAATGAEEWVSRLRAPVLPVTSLAAAGGKFFMVDLAGGMFALDEQTGEQVWDFQFNQTRRTERFENAFSVPVVAGDYILTGLADGRLAAVDARTGHLAWEMSTGEGLLQAVTLSSETIVVTKSGEHGAVLAFRSDPAGSDADLLDVESPTTLRLGRVLAGYAGAVFLIAAVGLAGGFALRRRRARRETAQSKDDDGAGNDDVGDDGASDSDDGAGDSDDGDDDDDLLVIEDSDDEGGK